MAGHEDHFVGEGLAAFLQGIARVGGRAAEFARQRQHVFERHAIVSAGFHFQMGVVLRRQLRLEPAEQRQHAERERSRGAGNDVIPKPDQDADGVIAWPCRRRRARGRVPSRATRTTGRGRPRSRARDRLPLTRPAA